MFHFLCATLFYYFRFLFNRVLFSSHFIKKQHFGITEADFLQARCLSCQSTNRVKAPMKEQLNHSPQPNQTRENQALASSFHDITRDFQWNGQHILYASSPMNLFHRRTRASYVYNGCLAWYNVVLTHGSTQA